MESGYDWIVYTGGVFAVFAAFGIGANDVANAFATSVGSGALSIRSAVMLAGVFEFLGSVVMGSHVTKTVRKGIADYECFEEQPELLMYGCMYVIASVGVWLMVASRLELPVSTTHSAVGGMIGMTMVTAGSSCVLWDETTDEFPYRKGVTAIIISWILSPILSGICAAMMFYMLRKFCLRSMNAFENIWYAYPFLIGTTTTINTFFILWKGAKNASDDVENLGMWEVIGISFGTGVGVSVLTIPLLSKLRKRVEAMHIENGSSKRVKDIIENDKVAQDIHENAEVFDPKAEEGLKYLQIFTAICDSFGHGANDVANAIGPFAAIYIIHKNNGVSKSSDMGDDAYWILSLGGAGIVLGLALYGYKIINAIGTKISKITPSRGICIELGAAIVIIVGSRYGWPLSTTHCQIGATAAVALLEGKQGLNWGLFLKTCAGWILTLAIVGTSTAALVAQGIYAPEKMI